MSIRGIRDLGKTMHLDGYRSPTSAFGSDARIELNKVGMLRRDGCIGFGIEEAFPGTTCVEKAARHPLASRAPARELK